MRLRAEPPIEAAAEADGLTTPTDLQRRLFMLDALGADLLEAAERLQGRTATELHDELNVTAFEGLYARSVAKYLRRRRDRDAAELLRFTQHLGGPAGGLQSTSVEKYSGPVAAADGGGR